MSDHTLRGHSIGGQSLESDLNVEPAPRDEITYICPRGDRTIVPFSEDADAPIEWICRCGLAARREDISARRFRPSMQPKRSHWDMLLERRTEEELKEVLEKRLQMHRDSWIPDYE